MSMSKEEEALRVAVQNYIDVYLKSENIALREGKEMQIILDGYAIDIRIPIKTAVEKPIIPVYLWDRKNYCWRQEGEECSQR
jgi:hypothetical protein